MPLAFLGPAAAAVAICAASVLSLAAFQTLTVAGLVALLIALYRLGRSGAARSSNRRTEASWDAAQFLAPALAVPFLVLALAGAGRAGSEEDVLVVLLAALAPAAALAGIARRARSEALVHSTARQAIAGTLVEHTARGERARIARELHDVVAHHISMIAVQAETARLATPGMPAAGAQRLLEIGDTARAGLTEMRRLLGVLREDAQAAGQAKPMPTAIPSQVCSSSTSCSTRPGMRQAQAPGSSFPGPRPPSIPVSSWPPTASSRKRSPTPGGTRRAPRSTWSCTSRMTPCGLRIRDNGPGAARGAAGGRRWARAARHARACRGGRRRVAHRRRSRRRLPDRGHAARQGGDDVMTTVPPAVRIIVADDHHVVRTGFAALLDTQPDFTVVGTACDGTEAVRICRELSPDVVLMDVRMPVMDGIEATRQLAGPGPDGPRILILTTFDLDAYVYDALCAGASGFLLKDVTAERLFEGVRVVAAGEALLAPAVTRRLISEFTRLRPKPDALPAGALATLTPRETQVLRLVAEGLSNPEIAARLVVTEETVKTHVSHVLTKLGLRDRTQAVVTAYETGLVVPRRERPGRRPGIAGFAGPRGRCCYAAGMEMRPA